MKKPHRPRHPEAGQTPPTAELPLDVPETRTHPLDAVFEETAELPVAPGGETDEALAIADDRFLRLAAEFDNYRRRTTKEKAEAFDRGAGALVERILDVLDDVSRLAASDPAATTEASLRSAIQLIEKKLNKELEHGGLERIDPVGEPFDPNQHEAVAVMAPESPEQDHTVRATFQAGYRFRGNVIRPAKVQVWSSAAEA